MGRSGRRRTNRKTGKRNLPATGSSLNSGNNFALYLKHAKQLFVDKHYQEAKEAISEAIKLNPTNAEGCYCAGLIFEKLSLLDDAERALRKALKAVPGNPAGLYMLGVVLSRKNREQEAIRLFQQLLQRQPNNISALTRTLTLKKYRQCERELSQMELLAQSDNVPKRDKILLCFSLGEAFHVLGEYSKASPYLLNANMLKKQETPPDLENTEEFFRRVEAVFTPSFFSTHQDLGFEDDTPIFITGLPRSGKTVTETLLSRHPLIEGVDESELFSDSAGVAFRGRAEWRFPDDIASLEKHQFREIGKAYVDRLRKRYPSARFVAATTPGNDQLIGLIRLCLPQARIIRVERDANDTCFEIFKKNFANENWYSYDLKLLGKFYRQYRGLMEYWDRLFPGSIYTVQFEKLIIDPTAEFRKLVDFCGLEWDDRHFDPGLEETDSMPSPDNAIDVWKPYAAELAPLFNALEPN